MHPEGILPYERPAGPGEAGRQLEPSPRQLLCSAGWCSRAGGVVTTSQIWRLQAGHFERARRRRRHEGCCQTHTRGGLWCAGGCAPSGRPPESSSKLPPPRMSMLYRGRAPCGNKFACLCMNLCTFVYGSVYIGIVGEQYMLARVPQNSVQHSSRHSGLCRRCHPDQPPPSCCGELSHARSIVNGVATCRSHLSSCLADQLQTSEALLLCLRDVAFLGLQAGR